MARIWAAEAEGACPVSRGRGGAVARRVPRATAPRQARLERAPLGPLGAPQPCPLRLPEDRRGGAADRDGFRPEWAAEEGPGLGGDGTERGFASTTAEDRQSAVTITR